MADYFNMNPATGKPYDDAWINKNGAGAWLSQGGDTWDAGSSLDGGRTAMQLAPGQLLPGQTQASPSTGWSGNTPAGAGPGSPGYVPQQPAMQPQPQAANLGMGQPTGYAPPQQIQPGPAEGGGNPYLGLQGGAIARRMTDNLQRNVLPGMGMGAMAAGGYGGSAHGVLQANAVKDMNLGLGDSLAGLYGNDWTQSKNRELGRYGMDQGFYTQQRGQDLQQVGLGADLLAQGQKGQWTGVQGATGAYSPFTGLGTSTQSGNTGGGVSGAIGGALGAGQFAQNMGWFGNKSSVSGGGGWGTGSDWGNQDYGSFL